MNLSRQMTLQTADNVILKAGEAEVLEDLEENISNQRDETEDNNIEETQIKKTNLED